MTVKNSLKTRRKYDSSFKEDVLKMIFSGRSVRDVAKALGISASLIHRWNKLAKVVTTDQVVKSGQSQSSLSVENERLKAELRRTEQERDILKKALGIFSRGI